MRVHNTVQGAVTETIPPKNKCKKAKWLWRLYKQLRKEEKQKVRDKGKDIPKWIEFQGIAMRDKAFLNE